VRCGAKVRFPRVASQGHVHPRRRDRELCGRSLGERFVQAEPIACVGAEVRLLEPVVVADSRRDHPERCPEQSLDHSWKLGYTIMR
jgi:hypothetical protein